MLEFKNLAMSVAAYLPFISAAVVSKTQLNLSSLVSRLLESAIIAAVILYANVQVIDTKLNQVDKDIIDIRIEATETRDSVKENQKTLGQILIQLEGLRKDIQYQTLRSGK